MTFTEFCKKQGVELLRDDERFIKNIGATKKDLLHYVKVWKDEIAKGRGQNQGRLCANTWLRRQYYTKNDFK